MKVKKRNKKIMSILVISLIGIFLVINRGKTLAFFTGSVKTASALKASTVKIKMEEKFTPPNCWKVDEGVDKKIFIKNEGNEKAYVRVRLKGVWQENKDGEWIDTPLTTDNVNIRIDNDSKENWIYNEGFYYYKGELNPNESTNPSLNAKITLKECNMEEYKGKRFKLKALSEGIQAKNKAYKDVWKINSLPWQ